MDYLAIVSLILAHTYINEIILPIAQIKFAENLMRLPFPNFGDAVIPSIRGSFIALGL